MKLRLVPIGLKNLEPAAFRRLCVETGRVGTYISAVSPAAFRRLCVETIHRFFGLRA